MLTAVDTQICDYDDVRGCISRRDSLVTGQEGLVVYRLYIVAANPEGSAGSVHPRVYIPSGCLRPPQD